MSKPQDDVGTAIAKVFETTLFSSLIDRSGYGTQKSSAGRAGKLGVVLVRPETLTLAATYDDSVLMQYEFSVMARLKAGKRAPELAVSEYLHALRITFQANSRELKKSFVNTSQKMLGSTLLAATVSSEFDTLSESPQAPEVSSRVTVLLWESI